MRDWSAPGYQHVVLMRIETDAPRWIGERF